MADKESVTLRLNLNAEEVSLLKKLAKQNERSMGGEVTYHLKAVLRSSALAPEYKESQNE